jgi:hypothetical protein
LIQTVINKDAADEALKSFRDVLMPYLPKIQKDDRSQHIKRLMSEVARGPMSITPVMQKSVKSKLKTRHVTRSAEEELASTRRITKKIGGFL